MALIDIENIKENFYPSRKLAEKKEPVSKFKSMKEKSIFAAPLVVMPEKRRPLRNQENIIKDKNNLNGIKNNFKPQALKLKNNETLSKVQDNVCPQKINQINRVVVSRKASYGIKKVVNSKTVSIQNKSGNHIQKITLAKKTHLSYTGKKVVSAKIIKKFKASNKKVIDIRRPDIENISSNTGDEYTDALSTLNQEPIDEPKFCEKKTQPSIISPIKSFSSLTLQDAIEDIDIHESHDEFYCSIYAKDIFEYMYKIEKFPEASSTHIVSQHITTHMRHILIDWIIQIHQHYKLLPETLYLTVNIVDRYLQVCDTIHKKTLQLVGVTAMFIACKFEELYIMEVRDFVHVTKNTYAISDILSMEISILKALDFSFSKPYTIQFLRRFSKITASLHHHTVAKFFLELSLLDINLSNTYPSIIAASSLCLSINILQDLNWNKTLEHYSQYSETELVPTMQSLLRVFQKAMKSDNFKSVFSKYSSPKLINVPKMVTEFLNSSQVKWVEETTIGS